MQIISHRGYWKTVGQKNCEESFIRSFQLCFGTETDIRDYNGDLVISHDVPNCDSLSLSAFFDLCVKYLRPDLVLALNIKSDGLQNTLLNYLNAFAVKNYFVFDMSIPDTLGYIEQGINFFSRQSEYEPLPAFYEECAGIWLDSFESQWYSANLIIDHLNRQKYVAIVSPELHNREHIDFWQYLKEHDVHNLSKVILCTDYPEVANHFFRF